MKNASVALISAKYYNPNCDVAFATNLACSELPNEFLELLSNWKIHIIEIPYDTFRFPENYTWSLAFYKLCVLKKIAEMDYQSVCYLDTDVYIQGSLDTLWDECKQHIMLYDMIHSLNNKSYIVFVDEVSAFLGEKKLITHYGGEFFAATKENANVICEVCEDIYKKMMERNFVTTKGDEFILSIAAEQLKANVKNAGAYIERFWTGDFRLVSTRYEYDRVMILHLPAEKERGMLTMYEKYIKNSVIPDEKRAWKIFCLSKMSFKDTAKKYIKHYLRDGK